jgi:hypothetical protein
MDNNIQILTETGCQSKIFNCQKLPTLSQCCGWPFLLIYLTPTMPVIMAVSQLKPGDMIRNREADLCWLLGSSARVYAVKEDYHAVLPS